jgi:cell division protein FtsL
MTNSNHKRQKSDPRIRTAGLWVLILSIFILQLMVYTWSRIQCREIGYNISEQAEKYRDQLGVQNNLKIELARLKSPERISKKAQELGMINPTPEQMIVIHDTK